MDVQSSSSQLSYIKKILCIQYVCSFTFKASYSSSLCTDPPPTPPFRKNPIFPEGRVVCTQANIPVTVWFIERKEERRNFGSL